MPAKIGFPSASLIWRPHDGQPTFAPVNGLLYADCFAAALAGDRGLVVTSDAKDFREVPWVQLLELPSGRS